MGRPPPTSNFGGRPPDPLSLRPWPIGLLMWGLIHKYSYLWTNIACMTKLFWPPAVFLSQLKPITVQSPKPASIDQSWAQVGLCKQLCLTHAYYLWRTINVGQFVENLKSIFFRPIRLGLPGIDELINATVLTRCLNRSRKLQGSLRAIVI